MLNEYVYCPRLYYYEHVEGIFLDNDDTIEGRIAHKKVDSGKGGMPRPGSKDIEEKEKIHSRSVTLSSSRLKVIAKMDLIEVKHVSSKSNSGLLFDLLEVVPVDYKKGSPKVQNESNDIWDADRIQLGVQIMILRENGYQCNEGVIYYCGTKQRVRKKFSKEWEKWICSIVDEAIECRNGSIPPPLVDSPKCVRCSLAPVCLPDETNWLIENDSNKTEQMHGRHSANGVRRLIVPRDDKRALYLNTQGTFVGRSSEVLQMKEKGKVVNEARIGKINHVSLFGNIQLSTQAIQMLCRMDVPVTYFSMGGYFYGLTRGLHQKNVMLRIMQFRKTDQMECCLELSKQFVFGKIHNQRIMLRRNHVELPEGVMTRMKNYGKAALHADSMESLLGIEGSAAAMYFKYFSGMIKASDNSNDSNSGEGAFAFFFEHRERRPPKDPVNALLSLAYSMLAKDCAIAANSVGFDPFVGFYHQPRHGRMALALDVMEEFRPLVADSSVLIAVNNQAITTKDFVRAGDAVSLSPRGRAKFFQVYEQRINHLLTHPVFKYKLSYRRAIELQMRILARVVEDQIDQYIPIKTR